MKKITALALIAISTIATSSYSMFSSFLRAGNKVKRSPVIQQHRKIIHIKPRATLDGCGQVIPYSPAQQITDWANGTDAKAKKRSDACISVEVFRLKKEADKKLELFTEALNQEIIANPNAVRGMINRIKAEESRLEQQGLKNLELFVETWAAEILAEGKELDCLPAAAREFAWSHIQHEAAHFGTIYVAPSNEK